MSNRNAQNQQTATQNEQQNQLNYAEPLTTAMQTQQQDSSEAQGLYQSLLSTYGGQPTYSNPGQLPGESGGVLNSLGTGELLQANPQTGTTPLNNFQVAQPNSQGVYNLPVSQTPGASAAGGDFSGASAAYTGLAQTGNAADYAAAQGTANNLASTGGINGQAILQRDDAMVPAFYNQVAQSAQTQANTQGGYSPGFNAQQAAITRQAGQDEFTTNRQAEGDVAQLTQQGIEAGLSGQESIASGESQNIAAGAGGLTNIGGLEQQNNQFNAGLAQSNQQFNNQEDLAYQSQEQAQGQQGNEFSASQLQGLQATQTQSSNQALAEQLAGTGQLTQADLEDIQLKINSNQPINWSQYANAGADILGTALAI